MTSSSSQPAPQNKKTPKFIYRGPNEKAFNVIFELMSSPDKEGDEWKNGKKMIYLSSLEKYVQPDSVKSGFCDVSMGALEDDVIVNAHLPKVDLSKKMGESGEADSIAGGFFAVETEEDFKKYYHQIGQK